MGKMSNNLNISSTVWKLLQMPVANVFTRLAVERVSTFLTHAAFAKGNDMKSQWPRGI